MDEIKKILLVDDDPDHLALVQRFSEAIGIQYASATNGTAAIDYLQKENFNLVVTDMVMPGMDGMELLKYIKEHHPEVDVIVMTGFHKFYSYIDVIKAGAADFISKPFVKDEYSAKLNRVFREKSLLMELHAAKEKAESASKAKTKFLNTISHEFRTPMNGIFGVTSILQDTELNARQQDYLEMLTFSAERLMKLISQILDYAQLEDDKRELVCSHFCLTDVLNEFLASMQPKAQEKNLPLILTIEDIFSQKLLFGDASALTQVLHHLVENAIIFSEKGEIQIQVTTLEHDDSNIMPVHFSVCDEGCGIPEDQQAMIFEPFTQAEEYMTRRHEGSGLGLALCAKLVSLMDGRIWVESMAGRGSAFHFTVTMGAV